VSGDGAVIAALGEDGTVRVWHPGAPDGADLDVSNGLAVAVSDDGTRVAGVSSGPESRVTELWISDPAGRSRVAATVEFTPVSARLSFQPGSPDAVLVNLQGRFAWYAGLFDVAEGLVRDLGEFPPPVGEWLDEERILLVGRGFAHIVGRDGSRLADLEAPHVANPTAITRASGFVAVGYDDGRLTTVTPDDLHMSSAQPLLLEGIGDVALSADGRLGIASGVEGSLRRFEIDRGFVFRVADVMTVTRAPVSLATGRVRSDFVVTGIDGRVELRTVARGSAGAFARRLVDGQPTARGGLLVATSPGHELVSPEGTVPVDQELFSVVSNDGSTFLTTGPPPRVGPVGSGGAGAPLELAPTAIIATGVALSADGSIAALEVYEDDASPDLSTVRTFDGRTGRARAAIELEPVGTDFLLIQQLLVSDHVIAFERLDVGERTRERPDGLVIRTQIHGRGWTRTIVDQTLLGLSEGATGAVYVAGETDGVITAYPVDGGEPVELLAVGTNDVVTAVGTDVHGGALMAVGYRSGRVELWNLETGGFIVELSRHDTEVKSIAIGQTPGGFRVSSVAGGFLGDGIVRTLDDVALLRGTLCALAGRDLSEAEWRRFVGIGDPLACARGL
jgi:WD40 repeat protein